MANKFFSYSFQVERTKKTGIIFVIFVVVVLVVGFLLYRSKSNTSTINNLSYNVVFGANEFEDTSCDKAYRISSEKKTCGTICIKVLNKNSGYTNKVRKEMEKNGFSLTDDARKKINNRSWNFIKTEDAIPRVSYYIADSGNKTYAVEVIDQSDYLTTSIKNKCKETTNKVVDSLNLK